jgi:Lrp/AsnC family transcriptional regulator, regulator for asnA, asnC and gidA
MPAIIESLPARGGPRDASPAWRRRAAGANTPKYRFRVLDLAGRFWKPRYNARVPRDRDLEPGERGHTLAAAGGARWMARPIDELDRAVIQRLQHDGRMSSAEIARQLGVAERTVRARIDRLVADNVIRVVALIVPSTAGFTVTADVFLEVETGRIQEIAELVAARPEVGYVGLSTGDRDISIQIHAPSVEALYDFVTNDIGAMPGVVRTNTFIIPKIIKTHFDFVGPDMQVAVSDNAVVDQVE